MIISSAPCSTLHGGQLIYMQMYCITASSCTVHAVGHKWCCISHFAFRLFSCLSWSERWHKYTMSILIQNRASVLIYSTTTVMAKNLCCVSYVNISLHVYNNHSAFAFDKRLTFWLQRIWSLPCACTYVALFACRLSYNHHTSIQCNKNTHKAGTGVLKPKSYSLVEGNRSIH